MLLHCRYHVVLLFFFFKQKTAYEMRISDRSSDVCSSDLLILGDFDGGIAVNHVASYRNLGVTPAERVKTWTTVDLQLGLRIGDPSAAKDEIGRASCRERVCQYV